MVPWTFEEVAPLKTWRVVNLAKKRGDLVRALSPVFAPGQLEKPPSSRAHFDFFLADDVSLQKIILCFSLVVAKWWIFAHEQQPNQRHCMHPYRDASLEWTFCRAKGISTNNYSGSTVPNTSRINIVANTITNLMTYNFFINRYI